MNSILEHKYAHSYGTEQLCYQDSRRLDMVLKENADNHSMVSSFTKPP